MTKYYSLYKNLLDQGLVSKPNGFLVDVGVDHAGRVVILDVGDLLNKQDAEAEGFDWNNYGAKFSEYLLLPSIVRDYVNLRPDGQPTAQIVDAEEVLRPKVRSDLRAANPQEVAKEKDYKVI